MVDDHCSDGSFCNGAETCSAGVCLPGPGDPCAVGPDPYCEEGGDVCLACLADAHCSDGSFCNGAETCDAGVCQSGPGDPCVGGPDPYCEEVQDACIACLSNDDCSVGTTCISGACVSSVPVAPAWWLVVLAAGLLASVVGTLARGRTARR